MANGITLLPSAARTANGTLVLSGEGEAGAGKIDTSLIVAGIIELDVTAAATNVADTLNVFLQHSVDGTNYDDFVSFTQVLGNGGAKRFNAQWRGDVVPTTALHAPADGALAAGVLHGPVGDNWRLKWNIVDGGGAVQSFTFSVSARFVHRKR